MADGRHIAKCWKRYNLPINGRTWMKLGWSHLTMSPTCPPWCGCHGNCRCLATAHCTFSSYGRLEAERVNQFWWNLVHNSKLGPQWQSRDKILKFLKFKMAEGRHVGKYSKCHNSPTTTWVVTSHHVPDMSAMMRLPCQGPLPSNGALNILQLWASGDRTRKPILMKFGMQQQVRTTITVTGSNSKIFKIQIGGRLPCCKIFEML